MSSRFIICALIYISSTRAQFVFVWPGQSSPTTTTTITTTNYEVTHQDEIDAQAIVNDKMSEKIFASILPYREKVRRMTIIREVGAKNGGNEYIADSYVPQQSGSTPFKDLIYCLTKDENMVLGGYLEIFFERKDTTWITIAMVLTPDIQQMIKTYDTNHSPKTFKDLRKKQSDAYEHMLRVWVRENRQSNESGNLDQTLITQDVNALRCENDSGGWKENRDQIEKILMKKSLKYAQSVILEFEKATGNKAIEDTINGNISSHGLNSDLANAYASLARYIKNKFKYMAEIMYQYSYGSDKWAAWLMCVAVTAPEEWPKVDAEFQKISKGESLSKFIVQKMTDDKIMAEMIAVIVDSKFKPTTFTEIPKQGTGQPHMPPPAPQTVVTAPSTPSG